MTRGKPFPPGQSGNPAGRPPSEFCLTDCLRSLARERVRSGPGRGSTRAQALAAVLWRRALAGDLRAAALIGDRLDGRPGQAERVPPDPVVLSLAELVYLQARAEGASGITYAVPKIVPNEPLP